MQTPQIAPNLRFDALIAAGTVVNINNADQTIPGQLPGTPDVDSQRYIPGYFVDSNGEVVAPSVVESSPDPSAFEFIPLPMDPTAPGFLAEIPFDDGVQDFVQAGFATQADLQNYIDSLDPEVLANDPAFQPIASATSVPGSGGNILVEGNGTVLGDLSVSGTTSADSIAASGDVSVGGALTVVDDVFVGGRSEGLQFQIDGLDARVLNNTAAINTLNNRVDLVEDRVGVLEGQVAGNTADIRDNRRNIDRNRRGIAMVAALTHSTVLPDMQNASDINISHFDGKTGLGISYSRRINDNVQLNFAGASTTDFDEAVVRGGVGIQW